MGGCCQDAGAARCFEGVLSGSWCCASLCGLLSSCQSCALPWGPRSGQDKLKHASSWEGSCQTTGIAHCFGWSCQGLGLHIAMRCRSREVSGASPRSRCYGTGGAHCLAGVLSTCWCCALLWRAPVRMLGLCITLLPELCIALGGSCQGYGESRGSP